MDRKTSRDHTGSLKKGDTADDPMDTEIWNALSGTMQEEEPEPSGTVRQFLATPLKSKAVRGREATEKNEATTSSSKRSRFSESAGTNDSDRYSRSLSSQNRNNSTGSGAASNQGDRTNKRNVPTTFRSRSPVKKAKDDRPQPVQLQGHGVLMNAARHWGYNPGKEEWGSNLLTYATANSPPASVRGVSILPFDIDSKEGVESAMIVFSTKEQANLFANNVNQPSLLFPTAFMGTHPNSQPAKIRAATVGAGQIQIYRKWNVKGPTETPTAAESFYENRKRAFMPGQRHFDDGREWTKLRPLDLNPINIVADKQPFHFENTQFTDHPTRSAASKTMKNEQKEVTRKDSRSETTEPTALTSSPIPEAEQQLLMTQQEKVAKTGELTGKAENAGQTALKNILQATKASLAGQTKLKELLAEKQKQEEKKKKKDDRRAEMLRETVEQLTDAGCTGDSLKSLTEEVMATFDTAWEEPNRYSPNSRRPILAELTQSKTTNTNTSLPVNLVQVKTRTTSNNSKRALVTSQSHKPQEEEGSQRSASKIEVDNNEEEEKVALGRQSKIEVTSYVDTKFNTTTQPIFLVLTLQKKIKTFLHCVFERLSKQQTIVSRQNNINTIVLGASMWSNQIKSATASQLISNQQQETTERPPAMILLLMMMLAMSLLMATALMVHGKISKNKKPTKRSAHTRNIQKNECVHLKHVVSAWL